MQTVQEHLTATPSEEDPEQAVRVGRTIDRSAICVLLNRVREAGLGGLCHCNFATVVWQGDSRTLEQLLESTGFQRSFAFESFQDRIACEPSHAGPSRFACFSRAAFFFSVGVRLQLQSSSSHRI